MAGASLEELEDRIAYRFQNQALLKEAFTHSSYIQEALHEGRDNELMEFLGDAVLNFIVTTHLVKTFPDYDEGQLSLVRASLVSAAHLARVAEALGLGQYLRLGAAEERTGGRQKFGILVDSVEALLAAVYRDGGLAPARALVENFILPRDLEAVVDTLTPGNYKGVLQEYLQAQRLGPAEYRVVEEAGVEHRKVFIVEVKIGETLVARGQGNSKKAAEQHAASQALDLMRKTERVSE
jgi:ribonuclease-3